MRTRNAVAGLCFLLAVLCDIGAILATMVTPDTGYPPALLHNRFFLTLLTALLSGLAGQTFFGLGCLILVLFAVRPVYPQVTIEPLQKEESMHGETN